MAGSGGALHHQAPSTQTLMPNTAPVLKPSSATDFTADDERLMSAINNRDQAALNALHARYRPLLKKIVSEILPNESDVEETLQDIFMEIWNRAANFDPTRGKPLGWIIRMARRRAIDHYRKIRVRSGVTEKLTAEAEEDAAHTATTPKMSESAASLPDLRHFLTHLVQDLPREQGEVVRLNYFMQMSQREIAHFTGIPLGTIKTRLVLALKKLAQKSAPYREELYHV